MENLEIWEKVRAVPPTALKEIQAGRLKGKSDINPMWRLKQLTEQFGICGVGWKYSITKQWLETGGKDEIAAFVNIDLFVKVGGEWSEAIPGTGGSAFVANERNGPYVSDECFKMALTDAISVSCKALGFGADVYWDKDKTKYNKPTQIQTPPSQPDKPQHPPVQSQPQNGDLLSDPQRKKIYVMTSKMSIKPEDVKKMMLQRYKIDDSKQLTKKQGSDFIEFLGKLGNGAEIWFDDSEVPF